MDRASADSVHGKSGITVPRLKKKCTLPLAPLFVELRKPTCQLVADDEYASGILTEYFVCS
jgi:hypothetical protein